MAKYKDYPVYTYDEPATYSDFSGGINTDPSNEHLQPNEMRDCLNMHYSSAALVKRKGASLLCNIECEDELYNVQGVFLFTYRVTYIIIAADGKLYKGFYSPNAKIKLSRLPISVEIPESLDAYNPMDVTVGLDVQTHENINQKHDGFIYSYALSNNNKINLNELLIGEYSKLPQEIFYILNDTNGKYIYDAELKDYILYDSTNEAHINQTRYDKILKEIVRNSQIVKYNNNYYQLSWTSNETLPGQRYIEKEIITPDNSTYWISLDKYNTDYKDLITSREDILSEVYKDLTSADSGLVLDTTTNTWRKSGYYITDTETGVQSWISNGEPGLWFAKYNDWTKGSSVTYNNIIYICIKEHNNYPNSPESSYASADAEWIKIQEKKELLFQNHSNIEAATYNNKLYITTGTRFIVVELVSNELVANIVTPYSCNTTEITNIGYNYLSPYPELCRSTQYNQAITSIGGILAVKNLYGKYTLTPQMNFAQGETEHDYYFKWDKKVGDEWVTIYSYKDNTYTTKTYKYIEDANGTYIKKDNTYIPLADPLEGWDLYSRTFNDGKYIYTLDVNGSFIKLFDYTENKYKYYELAFVESTRNSISETTIKYKRILEGTTTNKLNLFTIEVDDANIYQYRVSFAKSFEQPSELSDTWDYSKNYDIGDKVSVQLDSSGATETYVCIKAHTPKKVLWDNCQYQMTEEQLNPDKTGYYYKEYVVDENNNYITTTSTPVFSPSTSTRTGRSLYEKQDDGTFKFICHDTSTIIKGDIYWEKEYTEQAILTENGVAYDWIVDEVDGEYFGQGTSTIAIDLEPEDTFTIIQSCRKITSDGNKFLLYDDRYNSGSWYKTIINNPAYITQRGGLSFKTNKNESLIKVIPFNGTLIAFANAEHVGGSIHMVTGNGDDWDDQSGYYSPYRRTTINVNVSCDNANTVQVCENILVFKYFDTLYYIAGSELNNEVISVYSCNDRVKHNNNFVKIPWDDNNCISEVTEDYYALIWKEKYTIEDEDLILDRPALKIKMYYKLGTQQNEKIVYPWLRDESDYFNIDHIVYIKGKPIYLYNNTLTTFHTENYTDFGHNYKCQVHFRGEDLNYPKMTKLISNILVYYHRNQYSTIDFDLLVKNEAGHTLLDSTIKRISLQDLRALKAEDKIIDGEMRLDSTILDSKVFNTAYKFPCLLADAIITATNDKEFSISSITYNYITSETPDQTAYDLYSNILRPKEVK